MSVHADDRDAELARHREAIDSLDREILEKLNARASHAHAIGALKAGGPAYRPEREAQILSRLATENAGPLTNDAVTGVFRQIMSACLALEQRLRIAYLGPAGTFSHAAVARHFGQFVDAESCATIDEVFRAVEGGLCRVRARRRLATADLWRRYRAARCRRQYPRRRRDRRAARPRAQDGRPGLGRRFAIGASDARCLRAHRRQIGRAHV